MAKPTGPLLAFDARGQIAKTQVYSSWRGRSYVRRYVIPSNPQSTGQMQTRDVFSWLQQAWKLSPAAFQEAWTLFATGQAFTNRNAFNKSNISGLRTATTLANLHFSPGAKGGLALTSLTPTAGSGDISVAFVAPTPPTGWSLTEVIVAAIADQDPHSGVLYRITAGTAAASPIVLSGLTAGQLYRVGGWPKWAKADGTVAYGPSIDGSATPT